MNLTDKNIIVSGASSGMGLYMTEYLLNQGCNVMALYRSSEKFKTNLGEMISHPHLFPFQVDLTQAEMCENVFKAISEKFTQIDGLVNFAGAWTYGDILELETSEWDFALNQNLKTTFLANKYAIQEMLKSNSSGSIVNVASVLALIGMTNSIAYSSAKAAVVQMTKNLAVDFGKNQIRVNCICPGLVDTPMTQNVFQDKEWVEKIEKYYPLGRLGKVEDIAPIVAFLLSDLSSWITGVVIPVDGGFSIASDIPEP